MDVSEAIAKRKSVRAYLDIPILQNQIDQIVEAGRWAPNAGPFQISVVLNAALRQKIDDRTHEAMLKSSIEFLRQRGSLPGYQPLYGAPVVILLSGPEDGPNSPINAALAAENMLLQGTALGLASCHLVSPSLALNGKNNRDLAQEAGIPQGYKLQCALVFGYPAEENRFTAGERTRKGTVNYVE